MSNLVKKIFLFITIVFSCLFISNFALANNDNMMHSVNNGVNTVRNAVGGAENVVENAAKGATTTVRDGLNNTENITHNTMQNSQTSATRTSTIAATDTTNNNVSNTVWTWFIVGIVALIVIGIIWYMLSRKNDTSNR